MKNFLKEILADPITGKDLKEETRNGRLFLSSDESIYSLSENVPVLLPQENQKSINPDLHSKHNSHFNYQQHYNEDALFFDYFKEDETAAGKEETRRLHQVISKHTPKESGLILDVGCGNGWAAKYFLSKGRKIISMDISIHNPMKVLKENQHKNHAAVVADVYHLPFKKNSFDVIIASEIMEHVSDPELFISKLMQALKPNGRLIITTPYNEKIEYYLCVHCNKPTPKNAHLHSFNEKNILNFIPSEYANYSLKKFSNKYMVRLRLNLLLSFLPFHIWRMIDSVANKILKKPMRFLIEIKNNN
ncbi:MAG TPA: class I SAM-dependent methyltransferase [Hanamia sp.]|nr:class I SAM-dependent methyltransferase [Hanamia sp.]